MQYSDNYNLKLPQRGVDRANVDDLDSNFETIDGALADDRQISLLMYDSSATYNTGDIVGYENPNTHRIRAYRCLEDGVTGPWDATKWAQTTLAAEIGQGGGGSSTFAGLSDVSFSNLQNGQVPQYNSTSGKWENANPTGGASDLSDLDDVSLTTPTEGQILTYDGDDWVNADAPDVDVTKTASGNPIEVSDSANAPLVKCVSAITGSQDLHGYDKPWVGGAGKNKYNGMTELGNWLKQRCTAVFNGDGSITITKTDSGGAWIGFLTTVGNTVNINNVPCSIGQIFVVTTDNSQVINISIGELDSNNTLITTTTISNGDTYTISENDTVSIALRFNMVPDFDGSTTIYPMVRATGTSATFTPYSNICPITAYTEGEIEVRGKNLTYLEQGTLNLATGAEESSTTRVRTGFIPVEYQQYYIASSQNNGWSIRNGVGYDENFAWVGNGEYPDPSNSIYSTNNQRIKYVRFVYSHVNTSETCTPSDFWYQFEEGSTATTYEPYTSNTHTTTFPDAIYRGSEDVVNGEVTSEVEVKNISDFTWNYSTGVATNRHYYISLPNDNILLSCYPLVDWSTFQNLDCCACYYGGYLRIKDTQYDDTTISTAISNFVTARGSEQIAYELATPTTETITPTNLPIKSLNGYSHIESSTGEMEIEYITSKYQPLVDLISESSGGDSGYSETTLWESVSGTHGQITLSDTLSNYDAICVIMAPNNEPTYRSSPIIPVSAIDTTGATHFGIFVSGATSYCSSMAYVDGTHISCESWSSNYPMLYFKVVGIKYGGSSQQTLTLTRSLSKGTTETEKTSLEPISEPLTDKTDSLSKDETELKEEDESKEIEEVTEEPEEEPTEEEPEEEPVDPEPSKEEEADER